VLTLLAIGVFVRLGFWQLHRADEKTALIAQFEAGQRSVVDLVDTRVASRYQQVRARGHYDAAHQVLLDNMPSESGRAGYRVLTPFELEGDGWWLVDRGWVPPGRTREELPSIDVPDDVRDIRGRIDRLPEPGLRMGDGSTQAGDRWPRVLNYPEHATLERELGRPLAAQIVKLDATAPDGYERVWHGPVTLGPGRHLAYAVQWFAFAATAAVLFLLLSFRQRRP
jgi:surfeit locus 1 family protein